LGYDAGMGYQLISKEIIANKAYKRRQDAVKTAMALIKEVRN
jgi:hypothetical protein